MEQFIGGVMAWFVFMCVLTAAALGVAVLVVRRRERRGEFLPPPVPLVFGRCWVKPVLHIRVRAVDQRQVVRFLARRQRRVWSALTNRRVGRSARA